MIAVVVEFLPPPLKSEIENPEYLYLVNNMKINTIQRSTKSQKGAALITALFFLVILTTLAMSSMNTNILDEKMAANTQEKNRAFQTAETALAIAMNNNFAFNPLGHTATIDGIGDYNAAATYTSTFLESKDAASVFATGANIQGGSQAYNYFNLSITATTVSGAVSTINAGAWHL